MRIVSWNCSGAFRNKTACLDKLEADILIIQECENPMHSDQSYQQWAGDHLWVGKNRHKGLGVFARKGKRIRGLDWQGEYTANATGVKALAWNSQDLQSFLPCVINDKLTLIGAWMKRADSRDFRYIGQLWLYLQMHKAKLTGDNVILCGDFNSNTIWDERHREWNHSNVVEELSSIGLHSLYHHATGLKQGKESDSTFFMNRKPEKPYHIDYAFVSENLLGNSSLNILAPAKWLSYSDHVPLVVDIP